MTRGKVLERRISGESQPVTLLLMTVGGGGIEKKRKAGGEPLPLFETERPG
jgi:hypothetical protein